MITLDQIKETFILRNSFADLLAKKECKIPLEHYDWLVEQATEGDLLAQFKEDFKTRNALPDLLATKVCKLSLEYYDWLLKEVTELEVKNKEKNEPTPLKDINDFIKTTNYFTRHTLEAVDIEEFSVIQLLQLIESSKQIIQTAEAIISELDEHN